MINIGRIRQKDEYSYRFPTIDFKFQNTGAATAFLWLFEIRVISTEIDFTPVLDFRLEAKDDALQLVAVNHGWGMVSDFEVTINSDVLDQIFSSSTLRYKGTIQSGEKKTLLSLTKELADPDKLRAINNKFTDYFTELNFPPDLRVRGIQLKELSIRWNGKDSRGIKYSGEKDEKNFKSNFYFLTQEGFSQVVFPTKHMLLPSDLTYIAFIDLTKNAHTQRYPISRSIPPGEVERFHIMIGAEKSCRVRVQFKFYIDKTKVINSEEFEIQVWNPINSFWHVDYDDGDALKRGENETLEMPDFDDEFLNGATKVISEAKIEHTRRTLEDLKRRLYGNPNYPFTNE